MGPLVKSQLHCSLRGQHLVHKRSLHFGYASLTNESLLSAHAGLSVAPLIFWRKEYITDSGGPGEHRGGLGQVMEISHAEGAPLAISKMFDRVQHPARGRDGGRPGATGRVYLRGGEDLRGMGRDVVPPGARLVLETPGGGGLGDPTERDAERVEDDVLNGYVSEEASRELYGVD